MTAPDDAEEYFRTIEAEFLRRRGAAMLLSPRDWALIGAWHEEGIPLRLVLQAIANVFDAFQLRAPAGRRINALSYCRQEVLSLQAINRSLRGAEAGRPSEDPAASDAGPVLIRHLGRLERRTRAAMARASGEGRDTLVAALALCASELKRLRGDVRAGRLAPADLDAALRDLDARLLEAARGALSPEDRLRIEAETDRTLSADRRRMTGDAFQATRDSFVARSVRQTLTLPRLTLFD